MADDLSSPSEHPNFQLIPCIILHDFSLLCSFIVNHLLYSSYFIFFAPYFIRLISFISPLFISAVLLSLLLTTTTALCPKVPQLELRILEVVIQELKSNLYDVNGRDECGFEDFEIYKMVFDGTVSIRIGDECDEEVSALDEILEVSVHRNLRNDVTTSDSGMQKLGFEKILENSVSVFRINDDSTTSDSVMEKKILEEAIRGCLRNNVTISDSVVEKKIPEDAVRGCLRNDVTIGDSCVEMKIPEDAVRGCRRNDVMISDSGMAKKIPEDEVRGCLRNDVTLGVVKLEEEKCLEKLFEELDKFEDCTPAIETCADSDKVIEELQKAEPIPVKKVVTGSEAVNSSDSYINTSQISCRSSSWRSNSSRNFNSHGSMKEEKEWRRTLACKLFEERHNSRGGEEGMDSLWEAYENDNSKNRKEIMINNKKMTVKNGTKVGIQTYGEEDEDDDDDEEEMSVGHLCCLQALKLSTGKMNLGMGKPNLLKISKALRGFGWLHHVKKKNKQLGKKSYGVIIN